MRLSLEPHPVICYTQANTQSRGPMAQPKQVSIVQPAGSGMVEPIVVLYESATTRVFRAAHAGGTVVCKEPLGPDAARRLAAERAVLERLAGIEGVIRLAPPRDGVLALEDCAGTPLAHAMRAGRCDMARVLSLAPRLARILAEVHRAGIVHRDIHPSNIVLSADGDPVLIDFELAVSADDHLAIAQEGQIVGTLGYLAPEQTGRTGRSVDQRADLYSLGVTLYEMAAGRLPFEAGDTLQLIHDHLVREPVAPSEADPRVPAGLSRIVLRLLAKAPEQRWCGCTTRSARGAAGSSTWANATSRPGWHRRSGWSAVPWSLGACARRWTTRGGRSGGRSWWKARPASARAR